MRNETSTEVSALDLQLLRVLQGGGMEGYAASEFAYVALGAGVLQCHHRRGRWRPQGAGFVGGSILSRFSRRGLAVPVLQRYGGWSSKYRISALGERVLRSSGVSPVAANMPEGVRVDG